jgi:hypothetical protein
LWPTPREGSEEGYRTRAARKGHKVAISYLETRVDYLENFAPRMWPTPAARDYKDSGELKATIRKDGKNRIDTLGRVVTANGMHVAGSLNPTWVEWLMGYPIEHTDLKDWVTPSSRKSRQKS